MPETADTAKGTPKDRSWLPLLGNGMPQVSGRLCEVSRPQGGVAFYVYCRGDLPVLPHFFWRPDKAFVDHSWFGRAGWFHPDTPQSSLFTVAIHREDGGMERDQFTTTFNSGAVPGPPPAIVSSRKRFPSVVTSYSNTASFTASLGAWAKCVSNSGCGVPGSKAGLVNGPEGTPALTATAIILPSAPTKNSSLPSPRQRGCSPPVREIFHWLSAAGNGRTYTSRCPDSSDVYAIQWLSGESWPETSLNSERRKGVPETGFRSTPRSIGSTQISHLVFGSNSE